MIQPGRSIAPMCAVAALFCFLPVISPALHAMQLQQAQVTRIINQVDLLPSQTQPRAATLNDEVRQGTAVRTASESRAELTFTDQTLTRMGENTLFSFNEGTRNMNLGGGVMLVHVPKGAGGAKISTAGVTAGVTGTTIMLEYHKNAFIKLITLEGTARLWLNKRMGESVLVPAGQMVIVKPDARHMPDPVDVDLGRLMQTSLLIIDFPPLASEPLIAREIAAQQQKKSKGKLIDTNLVIYGKGTLVTLKDPPPIDVLDQRANFLPGTTAGPVSEIGALKTINSPNPYVINSGSKIVTAPTIQTNGITSHGKFYRGMALDGSPSDYFFGSKSAFDSSSGFNEQFVQPGVLPMAAFRFSGLSLNGNPSIKVPNAGATDLALISVGTITAGGGGSTITFSNMNNVLLATQSASLNLGSSVTFAGIPNLTFYARGAGSNLALGSVLQNVGKATLYAEGSVTVNANETLNSFVVIAGVDFSGGTGQVVATQGINISAANNLNFTLSRFALPVGVTPGVLLTAGATLNLDLRNDHTVFTQASSVTLRGDTISMTADAGGTTIVFSDTASVTFIAGAGGIQGAETTLVQSSNSMEFTAGGDIVLNSLTGGDVVQSTAGSIHTSGSLLANQVTAAVDITSAGDLIAINSVTAGNNISVTNTLLSPSVTAGGNITAGHVEVQNINPFTIGDATTLTAGAGGITPFVSSSGSATPHVFNVNTVVSPNGINFNGSHFGQGTDGGNLTINAVSQAFNTNGINGVDFNGADVLAPGSTPGSGGTFAVNASGAISLISANIDATTGIIGTNDQPAGTGGNVTLTSKSGTVSLGDGRVLVSSSDAAGSSNRRSSARGGNITVQSDVSNAVAVNITSTAQLLSLLENAAPGPGGTISIKATGAMSSASVGGIVEADKGTVDIRNTGDTGSVTLSNMTVRGDVLKVAALGSNGTLSIGNGTLSANDTLKLYATGSNGQIVFVANCSIGGKSANIIAADMVTINNGVTVTTTGKAADVFVNGTAGVPNANYTGFGGNGSTTGTFGGLGATNPQQLSSAPPLD